jgi:NAD(P)H-hydrate repair Nnr-like enzyme with NAD(P)H-hydrate dehydratase domain
MKTRTKNFITKDLAKLSFFKKKSHKGENGKVLVIGGSTLFHSASIWAAELVAHFADLVFYYSPALINGKLLLKTKENFKNGIVIQIRDLESYIKEADVVMIGQGMRRRDSLVEADYLSYKNKLESVESLNDEGQITYVLANLLPILYPQKKWVIDAGALQEIEVKNIPETAILTPHEKELAGMYSRCFKNAWQNSPLELLLLLSKKINATWLFKSDGIDYVAKEAKIIYRIKGGNEGLTKGGSGDLLATLAGAFYIKNRPEISLAAASFILKKTAEALYLQQGPFFTTTELLNRIPTQFWHSYMASKNQA